MKLSEAINAAEEKKAGYLSYDEEKRYISLLDSMVSGRPVLYIDDDEELLIPEPFSEAYILFLKAQAELGLGEIENYNNTFILFRSLFDDYKRMKMRTGKTHKTELKLM